MKTIKLLSLALLAFLQLACSYDVPVDTQVGGHPETDQRHVLVPNIGHPADNLYLDDRHGRFIQEPSRYGYQNPGDRYVTPPKTYGDAATSRIAGFMPGSWEEYQERRRRGWSP